MTTTAAKLELEPDQLARRLDPTELPFETTAEVAPLTGTIGQPRALDAIEFGLEVTAPGYNLFVAGAPGSGRTATTRDYLERAALARTPSRDWVYVFNFHEPDRPNAIPLPAGRGRELAAGMEEFIRAARREIPRAFESDEYEQRRRELFGEIAHRRDEHLEGLQAFARERSYAVQMTPAGFVTIPLRGGRPLSTEDFEHLSPEERSEIEKNGEELQRRVADALRQIRRIEKEAHERLRALDRDVAQFATGPLFHDLREEYAQEPEVFAYLDQVQSDLPGHLSEFRPEEEQQMPPAPLAELQSADRRDHLSRYRVNVLIDNADANGAPVVLERNPTYYNLVGRIDYRPAFGTVVTDFHQIKAGALQRANGGFLVMQALDLLRNPFAWEALKRALLAREVRAENLAEQYSALPTVTLRPEPIPLDLKVVLIGSPFLYHLLYALDEDFRELFKVKVDFSPEMEWSEEHVGRYAAFISRWVNENGLRHFDRSAIARVVEHGARLRENQRKLSTRLIEIADVVTEASFRAASAGHELVQAGDVEEAIAKRRYRSNLAEERIHELIADGTLLIATEEERVGQVNGLAVLDLGDHAFGRPSRVTARVSLGKGSVTSVEREIELSGPIHSKGVLILSGYLAGRYAQEWPLSFGATITFEQSYDEVEGDSASSTELYALLSALSGIPLRQGIAVTGSVNQHGEVQAVGGVTTKIEGFFDVCKARGLTGEQGVVIPRANVRSLMLREEIVEAARAGRFHVWAVTSIDEGIEILTGRAAGERDEAGVYPEGSVHRLVEDRLREYAERLRAFGGPPEETLGVDDGSVT